MKIHLPIYDEDRCALFALGRNAMYAACEILKLRPGDEVLTPAFDCDGSLQPFRVLGLNLCFFRSDPYSFSGDVDDLRRRVTSKTLYRLFMQSSISRLDPEDYHRIRDRKRYWYTWLSDRVAQVEGVTVLWPDLPEGITPFCLRRIIMTESTNLAYLLG